MSKDLDPATTTDSATTTMGTAPAGDKPFVRILREKGTGNVIIALNAEALDGLITVLDVADLKEMDQNPSYLGLDADEGQLASAVGYDILGQLKSLAPYHY